jgi:membrane protease YdiL (CAAX protease family)
VHADDETFPSVWQAVLLLLANFLLQYVIGALLYDLRRPIDLAQSQVQALVMVMAYGIVLVSVLHIRRMTYRELLHPSRSSVSATLMVLVPPVLLLVPLVLLLDHALMAVVHRLFPLSVWEEQAFAGMVAGNLASVIATCVLAPIFEEMLFRGVLLRAFLTQHARWAAICYSALLFGAAHLNVYQFLLAFWLGLLLGWLYERSRSLVPCIALHAAVNTAVVVLELTKDPKTDSMLDEAGAATWLLALATATAGTIVLRRVLAAPPRDAADAV